MSKITSYVILDAPSLTDLITKVSSHIQREWQPIGGVTAIRVGRRADGLYCYKFMQAIVTYSTDKQ